MCAPSLARIGLAALVALTVSMPSYAGMPAPLPDGYEQSLRLTDSAHARLQAVSFFAVGLLAAAAVVQFLWNYVRRDLANLPRLSYPKALCAVVLWGLLSFVVLTMISGARELMTPGAWRKQGYTYRLADEADAPVESTKLEERRKRLDELRAALWHFAALHDGRFPAGPEETPGDAAVWHAAGGRLPYVYVPGLRADNAQRVLAAEPELDSDQRWILLASGEIRLATSDEIERLLKLAPSDVQP